MWVEAFGKGDRRRAEQYTQALSVFLGGPTNGHDYFGHLSPHTRKAYAYAIAEFFEWAASKHGRVVSPEDVSRKDAEDYVNWLANRPYSLASEKLKDGDETELREIYQIVERLGKAKLRDIIREASPKLRRAYRLDEKKEARIDALSSKVRELVVKDVLAASPTICELREKHPQAAITQWKIPVGQRLIAIEHIYTYSVREYPALSRTTITQRISALSAFWEVLMQGEGNKDPLIKHNVWSLVKKRVNRGISDYKKEASRDQRVPAEDIIYLLRYAPSRTLVQLRNKAILYTMVFAGLRTTELLELRRAQPTDSKRFKAWFDGTEPPALQLLRKGNKQQRIPFPPAALKVLIEFQGMLDRKAAPSYAQSENPDWEHYVPPNSSAWYYQQLQLPEAPLFPPLVFWGRNHQQDYRKSMTRMGLYSVLTSMAADSGLDEKACSRIHPHAIRHFAATAMVEGGKDLREVQAILGHSSVVTTEGYLEDIDDDVRLSGQGAILSYLQDKGVLDAEPEPEQPEPSEPARPREDVETYGIEVTPEDISDESPEVSQAEALVIGELEEFIPENKLPIAPPEFDPQATVSATPAGTVVETKDKIIGIESGTEEGILEGLPATVRDGKSPGSPDWVYERMADPKATHETVVFNRGGERDARWLKDHYASLLPNFGVGHESYLPWYVRAQGNITRGGYFRGQPPFPVMSPDQVNPETSIGKEFLDNVERTYSRFVHGDPENGILPSPLRSTGLVRWYSFFAYQTQKLQDHFYSRFREAAPQWEPYNAVVDIGNLRSHSDKWLLRWLEDNAHTFRATVDAMKRGVERGKKDVTASFLKSSFEGIELITQMPEWMIYDDPVRALYDKDPTEWRQMIKWLKNVTGQVLEPSRRVDRDDQEEFAEEEQKTQARTVRDILLRLQSHVSQLERAKRTQREKVKEYRDRVREDLVWYALAASGEKRLEYTLEQLKVMNAKEFNEAMRSEYERLELPDPSTRKYRGKEKISQIVLELFPTLPVLEDANIFGQSQLFNPKWFRIDEKNKTIQIEDDEREDMARQFGQNPELLVRRATRAMWESRNKDMEQLWGVMMSYFSWIVPTGREMESQVLGIPLEDLGEESLNIEARKNWLKYWLQRIRDLASGRREEAIEAEEPEWKRFLREEEGTGQDALDRVASDALDFVSYASIEDYAEDPESLYIQAEEGAYVQNTARRFLPNRRGTYVVLEGEKPKGMYKVDLFGKKKDRFKPNAPTMYMSPGAVYLTQKKTFVVRQLLPTPFRMVSAMTI